MLTDVPWRRDIVKSHLRAENGYWLPCEAPGLGVEVDENAAAKHPFQQEVMHPLTIRAADGAILDW
jgi:galactonate dehydratase